MRRILTTLVVVLFLYIPRSYGEYEDNSIIAPPEYANIESTQETDIQQNNLDEGYSRDDQEYYEAEGLNAEGGSHEK